MRNVLVVDDEINICEGIRTVLLEAGFGIEHVWMARNGYEALDYLRMEAVDLMISDIRMDEMDGLELLGAVNLEKPNLPVIIISAHEQFSYAQEVLRMGAKDYFVKPIDVPLFLKSVRKWLEAGEIAAREMTASSLTKAFERADLPPPETYVLNELLETPGLTEREVRAVWNRAGLPDSGPYFCLMRVRLALGEGGSRKEAVSSLKDRNLFKYAAANVIAESLQQWAPVIIPQPGSEITIVLPFNEEEYGRLPVQPGHRLGMLGQLVRDNISTYLRIPNAVGISSVKFGLQSLHDLKNESSKALAWQEMMPDQSVFYIQDFDDYKAEPDGSETGKEAFGVVNHSLLQKIQAFLKDNCNQKGLKLQDIADHVHLSTNHISYLFRKFLKMTVWDYVLKLRMEQAKKLLLTTDMKRYEIAEAIGYEAPEHFSKLFKKYYGVSPSEIRSAGSETPD
ncbi:response regulator transcription factor [Cohnella candidum]|uniref:Response regulator n=1 Tax=Cohnella candidum TaxID=2674991 RepID=A0A3G3K466_9BACL|nr:response regulator [Cohnella candidum]AYQ75283.1 response regulator [Cohnella candidum]